MSFMSTSIVTATTDLNQRWSLPVFLPGGLPAADGTQVFTGVHNEWAAKVGGGYRFNDGIGDLQLNAYLRVDAARGHRRSNSRSTSARAMACLPASPSIIGKLGLERVLCPRLQDPGQPGMSELQQRQCRLACAFPDLRAGRPVPGKPVRRFRQPVCGRRPLLLQRLGQLVRRRAPSSLKARARITVSARAVMATRSALAMLPTTRSAARPSRPRPRA